MTDLITISPDLFWFSGSFMTLFIMAIYRMSSPMGTKDYVEGSREYWEDGFYILFAWPGYLILLAYHMITHKPFRYG